jgi:hypothetical protein
MYALLYFLCASPHPQIDAYWKEYSMTAEERAEHKEHGCKPKVDQHANKWNHTAGNGFLVANNGIIIARTELYVSESCTQVYQHLIEIVALLPWVTELPLAFDDACHLYTFIRLRKNKSKAAMALWKWAKKYLRCDRMHFKNHKKGGWCEKNMDPGE